MKDPGPHVVALLKAILDKPAGEISLPPAFYNPSPIIYPAIFCDDGSGAFPYLVRGTGTGYEAKYTDPAAYVGPQGIEISTRETGATTNDYCFAEIYLPDAPPPIIRVQLLFRRPSTTSASAQFRIRLFHDDKTFHYLADFGIAWSVPTIEYWAKSNGTWAMATVPNAVPQEDEDQWHHLNFTINKLTHEYGEFWLNGTSYPLPVLDLEPSASEGRCDLLYLGLNATAGANEQAHAHYDQILVTAEEA